MVFSSILFLFIYLPITLAIYYIAPHQLKNLILFIISLIFYAWGEPIYVFIMIFSTIVDYIHGRAVEFFRERNKLLQAKFVVASSMFINISLLCFFKYADFLVDNINTLVGTNFSLLHLPLPIGISFYTFQTMSYTIDVYRGDAKAQKNIINFGTYVPLFPQLIAGPIVRFKTISEQLTNRIHTTELFAMGIKRFTIGLGKKVLLANNIGILWDQISVMDTSTLPILTAWLGIIAFTFQIYFDFSGYSDMAIGLGMMFGFRFLENFNYPYMAKSITEFWRRWHISLGTWFREYVYIPLGGNKKGFALQVRNLLIVWALTGIWHGASWNFMIWGIYFGIILVMEKLFLLKFLEKSKNMFRHAYTMILVIFSWVLFSFDSLNSGISYMKAMLGLYDNQLFNSTSIYYLYTNFILLVILILASTDYPKKIAIKVLLKLKSNNNFIAIGLFEICFLLTIFLLSTAYLVDATYNPFLYFRF